MFPEIEELKRKRKKLGVSQKKLAELVGVSQPLIARIESGRFDPKLSLIKRIQKVLEEIEGGRVKAKAIMNSPVITVSPEDSLKRAAEIMIEREISQLPVTYRKKVIGSITENDVVKAVVEKGSSAESIRVGEVMNEPFPAVNPDESLNTISKLLFDSPAVLVIEEGELVGIVTKQDVMKFLTQIR
ncbi:MULTISPECIES: CBS domain-containing protein [unclassified Archaeoglobus]|jgi:predicted transcriptional regulator|uniref:CBS domain-containing protein n=1 Tax=unclassified Archaeoglobus TaxID=2643606 RepID=UPI0025C2B90A|nr:MULTISPECIES: CBS domain-containing protein [unclassified Archaeoglobus]